MKLRISISIITLLFTSTTQNINTNTIDDPSPFHEATQAFLNNDGNEPDIGGLVSNLLQSEEGKQLGSMLVSAAMQGGGAANLISGLGSMLTDGKAGGGGGGLDPSMIANVMGMLAENSGHKMDGGVNMGDVINFAASAFQNSGINADNFMDYFPQIVSTVNAFIGPDAKRREAEHADHAWMMPPAVEKIHLLFDHFAHSELGRGLWRLIGAEKFFTMFSRDGRFDYNKLFDMLENQSFRRHWIKLWTQKITDLLALIGDPRTHKK